MLTVIFLVALRVGVGYHFLYEGVWKIKHYHEFTAEPFLSQAKGPVSGLFYAMLPDMYGKQRLEIQDVVDKKGKPVLDKDGKPKKVVNSVWLTDRWEDTRQQFVRFYAPEDADLESRSTEVRKAAQKAALEYLADNVEDIKGYLGSVERFDSDKDAGINAPFQQKRRWDAMMDLRKEAGGWIKELESREAAYKTSLQDLLSDEQKEKGRMPISWNPLTWTRVQQVNFMVTMALSAIGLCLVLGLFTRPAALGGALFMMSVVMTQPAWPMIYPPDPPVVGHALLVNKDFIEMLCLFLLATTSVGRWGGLDFFLHGLIIDPFLSKRIRKEN